MENIVNKTINQKSITNLMNKSAVGLNFQLNSSLLNTYISDVNQSIDFNSDLKTSDEFLREFLICSENFGEKQFSISRQQIMIFKICICLSIICLILNLMVYSFVPRLKNVPGKCLMSLCVAKIFANLCFLSSQFVYNREFKYWLCRAIAILRHYFILTVFMWTVVIAFDCYRTFRSSKSMISLNSIRSTSFLKYSLFCWSIPALFIASLIIIDCTVDESIFKPNYGLHVCSINSCEAFLMYGVVPIGAILMANAIYFVLILNKLYSASTETEMANRASLRAQCIWYTKLALILGLSWILSLIAIFIPISHIFFYTHAFSSLQGVIIFLAFTCRANVCHLLRRRLHYHMSGGRRRMYFSDNRYKRTNTQTLSRNQSLNNTNNEGSVLFNTDHCF